MMRTDRAQVTVESLIADHVSVSFHGKERNDTAARIRSRITDSFQPEKLDAEQDNTPPALVEFRKRIAAVLPAVQNGSDTEERSGTLADLRQDLQLKSHNVASDTASRLELIQSQLVLERQQLLLRNEFTEGFGRVETWILAGTALGLLLLNIVDLPWALPILAVSIGRSFYLDRQCKKRLAKVAQIDKLIERTQSAHT